MATSRVEDDKEFPSLDGQLLVAMPTMADERFSRTVIYMCAHAETGAMGLVVNKPIEDLKLADLFVQLEVIAAADAIRLPEGANRLRLLRGGPWIRRAASCCTRATMSSTTPPCASSTASA